MDPAAEELVHRLVERLAGYVPAGHLQAAKHAQQGDVGALRIAAAVDVAPHALDFEGIGVQQVVRKDILYHCGDGSRPEAGRVDFAHALNAAVRGQLQEDEVASAVTGRRIADDEGLESDQLHGQSPEWSGKRLPLCYVDDTHAHLTRYHKAGGP